MGNSVAKAAGERHAVIVSGEIKRAKTEWEELAKTHEVLFLGTKTRDELIIELPKLAATGKYDAIAFMGGSPWQGAVNRELLGAFEGVGLRYINGQGAGYDHVDLDWVSHKLGAFYTNNPGAVSHPTATATTILILDCIRWTTQMEASTRRGDWKNNIGLSPDTRDVVVGIIGLGTIGKIVRDQIQGFGTKVIYTQRNRLPPNEEKGATFVSFDKLIEDADLISLNTPLTPDTFSLIGEKEIARMKKGVMIVNTSRGRVLDEQALVAALQSGHVDRAGLDVFENEPYPHPYLLTSDKCTVFPHHGSGTQRVLLDGELEILGNVRTWLQTGTAPHAVNTPSV
ncbi:glycerate-and formate-dehydrogenase [Dacryopinax primogenitus]|uniref:Glycerate-and formate-dehydrogenase n=1 Tax=Dacryopinax primogenitus (strain DJM 731) TaxID=1858805 RepID=M5FNW7_DACPD|nr:glycerate-and formate-dehydrogenase [Dacryopinax primogenitus]EJT98010.1 glycerate-and formate-dehydrogenase [Dacryopinax primogenitus]